MAKVFGDGVLTIAVGPRGWPADVSIYVGTHRVSMAQAVEYRASVEIGTENTHASVGEVTLPPSTGRDETDLKIEEEARLLASLKWLRIRRQ